ncbi:MAG: metallophosphoesterase [Bacteroidetes bacterium]|nr:metallophosphoesterase [Bacteroidota bacterium]MCW5895662.1 metallophosphoesterase [Bacteroidota bacterium]
MRLQFLIFFSIWFGVIGLAHWYVGRRVIKAAQFTREQARIARAVVILLFLIPQVPFAFFLAGVQSSVLDILSYLGYIVMGFFTLVLTFFVLRDLVVLASRLIEKGKKIFTKNPVPAPVNDDRRRFLVHATNISIIGLAAAASGYGFMQAHRRPTVESVDIPLGTLPPEFEGFRILQFSDLHVGPTIKREYVEEVVAQILDQKADMIVFTGDLVDGSVAWLRDDVAPLKELKAPFGTYFSTGNHEYYSGVDSWMREASHLGFDVLVNEHRIVEKGEGKIVLAGVTDYGGGDFGSAHRSNPSSSIAGAPEGLTKILLAHQPRSIAEAAKAGFDLQLSGHTHGGQYFPGNYLARLNQPYIEGLHKHGSMWVYVNRGVGYWGPPIRLGTVPELTLFTLRKA